MHSSRAKLFRRIVAAVVSQGVRRSQSPHCPPRGRLHLGSWSYWSPVVLRVRAVVLAVRASLSGRWCCGRRSSAAIEDDRLYSLLVCPIDR
jgi:hypothetical protein